MTIFSSLLGSFYLERLVASKRGRAFLLNFMADAEDSDERMGFCSGFLESGNISEGSMKLLISRVEHPAARAAHSASREAEATRFSTRA